MPKIMYKGKRFSEGVLDVLAQATEIIDEYERLGFKLTLRQLYYQFVSRGLLPNQDRSYKRLGKIISDGRLAGLIDWDAIEDRTRFLRKNNHWIDPAEIVDICARQFAIDKWGDQEFRPEVWIEKDALVGVIEGVCNRLDVPYFSCRGYMSQSEMWVGAMRMVDWVKMGQKPLIIHLGDHDPSGVNMTSDIAERLQLFCEQHVDAALTPVVNRVALTMDQVDQYNPPPNPAKLTDTRARAYIVEFGGSSWELDALEPQVLSDLVRDTIDSVRDMDLWREAVRKERQYRYELRQVSNRWVDVVDWIGSQEG